MPQTSSRHVDESALTKGQLRKLNALHKSVGQELGERAFAEWLSLRETPTAADRNPELIAGTGIVRIVESGTYEWPWSTALGLVIIAGAAGGGGAGGGAFCIEGLNLYGAGGGGGGGGGGATTVTVGATTYRAAGGSGGGGGDLTP